jgi:F-box interacting protein
MYRHNPTHEFRLLLYPAPWYRYDQLPYDVQNGLGSYVFTLGSGQPPRHIARSQDVKELIWIHASFLFRGKLYWHLWRDKSPSDMIMVFDTTSESFRKMHAPAVPDVANLFEMGDMLSMSSYSGAAAIDIWVIEDYERETWAFKYRVELPVADISRCGLQTLIVVSAGWWPHLRMMACTCCSNLVNGYFMLTSVASGCKFPSHRPVSYSSWA